MENTIDKIILGVDPGTVVMGYSVVHHKRQSTPRVDGYHQAQHEIGPLHPTC